MSLVVDPPDDSCPQCAHSNDEHILAKPGDALWGWRVCPEPWCECFGTWSVNNLYGAEEVSDLVDALCQEIGLTRADLRSRAQKLDQLEES